MSQREPMFNFSEPAPVVLAAVLIIAHALTGFAPSDWSLKINEYALLAARDGQVDLFRDGISNGWSLILHAFLHADWSHVLMNSGMIAVFGVLVCKTAGRGWRKSARFLAIFFFGVVAGGLAQWLWWIISSGSGSAVGASGGGSALFAAAAYVLGGRAQLMRWGAAWAMLNLIMVVAGNFNILPNNIAWAAHLGGYVGGAVLALIMLKPNSTDFRITR